MTTKAGMHDSTSDTRLRAAVDRVRGEFDWRSWYAFWHAVINRQRPDEVARQLGSSAGAVRKAKAKVLRRIRDEPKY